MNAQLEYLAKEKGFNTLSDIARAMDKTPNTFFSNLRYLIENKTYTSKFAKALFDVLKVSADEFKNYIESPLQQKKRLVSAKKLIDQKALPFLELKPSQENDIIELIDSLNEGDIYTLVTRKVPIEFSNVAFKNVMVAAAARGVYFRYIFPVKEISENMDVRLSTDMETLLPTMFGMFSQNLGYLLEKIRKENPEQDFPKSIVQNLKMSCSADPILMNPLHSYILVEQKQDGKPMYFVMEEISSGKASTVFGMENAIVWYPLVSDAGIYVAEKVNYEFLEEKAKKQKRTSR